MSSSIIENMKRFQRTTGFGSPAEAYAENDIDWNKLILPKPHAMFIFYIEGNGFSKYGIFDRDLAVIDCSLSPGKDDLVVKIIDGEFGVDYFMGTEHEIIGVVSRIVRMMKP